MSNHEFQYSLPEPDVPFDHSVNVRMTEAQKLELVSVAKQLGVSASEVMRHFTWQALEQLKNTQS
ncbi:MAG: hypothetical protein AAFY41_07370 [Bacteroidota bacterium]